MNWKPIEQAKKDDKPILVWAKGYHPTTVTWEDDSYWDLCHAGSYAGDGFLDFEPTHFCEIELPE